jgi:23S rRNA (cytosine1962-C5)-methyltransferase
MAFSAAADFAAESAWALRQALIETELTEAYRVLHGAAEGRPGWYVDRLGPFLLSQSERELDSAQGALLADWLGRLRLRGVYHQRLDRCVRASTVESASPRRFLGEVAPAEFVVRENGVKFALSFAEGYSVGLFLDQRDNRRRLLRDCVGADFPVFAASAGRPEILNLFAYTCGFSVCAALAGARTTSVDVSRKYLAWGRRNFELNGLDAAAQEFLHGDAFVWLRRLARKGRAFEVVLVDPPAFSTSKERGVFRAESDYGKLVAEALPLVKAGGVLFASTSARRLTPKQFLSEVESAIQAGKRTIVRRHYAPQPPDFPVTRAEPAHLKSIWLRLA